MDLSPSDRLKAFFATSRPSYYKKGDVVLRPGDARSGAYYVRKGFIKDSSTSLDGQEFTLFIFKPNDLFSYSWIFNGIPNEHSFRAISDCIIYEKSRESLLLFLNQNSDILFMVSQSIAIRMRGLLQRAESLATGSAPQKVSSAFYLLADRFGKKSEKGITVPISLTQQDIAELIGISRETTSIEIKKLVDRGIILKSTGFYIITNINKIQKLAGILG